MMSEEIRHAAVRAYKGMIFLGKCHADCFHQAGNVKVEMKSAAEHQGFFTSEGRFVDRLEARAIAVAAGQIDSSIPGGRLFSEELWSEKSGGKFKYDSIKGYFRE